MDARVAVRLRVRDAGGGSGDGGSVRLALLRRLRRLCALRFRLSSLRFSERSLEFRAQLAALALAQLQVIKLSQLLAQSGDDGGS